MKVYCMQAYIPVAYGKHFQSKNAATIGIQKIYRNATLYFFILIATAFLFSKEAF